jgi:phosphatidylglycerophosphatase A
MFGELPPGMRLTHPAALIATWFGAGLLPIGPGTWGSAAALPFAWAILSFGGWPSLLACIVAVAVAGYWASGVMIAGYGDEDPPEIVVDEVVAQWMVLLVAPQTHFAYFIGFLIFRVCDTLKPWPASWADTHVSGAMGVMLDDLLAGAYALAIMAGLVQLGWV